MKPGIYCFWNIINNKIYVGSTQDLDTRIKQHFKNCHNLQLKRAIKKYSIENFRVITWETEKYKEEEQKILDYIFSNKLAKYNVSISASGGKNLEDYTNHGKLTAAQIKAHKATIKTKGGYVPVKRFGTNLNCPNFIYEFESSVSAYKFTGVLPQRVSASCKNKKPVNSSSNNARWLFSLDKATLVKATLTKAEITGFKKSDYIYLLYNSETKLIHGPFKSINIPLFYNLSKTRLSCSLSGSASPRIKDYLVIPIKKDGELVDCRVSLISYLSKKPRGFNRFQSIYNLLLLLL